MDDYRHIGYKCYSYFLLRQLKKYLQEAPHFQAAFMKNRSREDYMFTSKWILEEEWIKEEGYM